MARLQARRGYSDGASWLDTLYPSHLRTSTLSLSAICDYLHVHRFQGLHGSRKLRHWCRLGLDVLPRIRESSLADVVALRCMHAFDVYCQGRIEEAWDLYGEATPAGWQALMCQRDYARICTEKAAVLRRLEKYDDAMRPCLGYYESLDRFWIILVNRFTMRRSFFGDVHRNVAANGTSRRGIADGHCSAPATNQLSARDHPGGSTTHSSYTQHTSFLPTPRTHDSP